MATKVNPATLSRIWKVVKQIIEILLVAIGGSVAIKSCYLFLN